MQIEINKNKNGRLFAWDVNNCQLLFEFEFRKTDGGPAWCFWLRGDNDPDIFEGEKFPYGFFKGSCIIKSFAFNKNDGIRLGEDVEIINGEKFLKV